MKKMKIVSFLQNVDMGSVTTIFSDDDIDQCGKFICDVEVLMKEVGQDIPEWLSEVSLKYSSRLEKERGFFLNLMIFCAAKICKVFQFLWFVLFTFTSDLLKMFHFVMRSIVTTFINNEVKKLKSALWILFKLSFICLVLFISFIIIFGNYSMEEGSDSLYLNMQILASDMYNNFKTRWMKKIKLLYDFYFT